MAVPPAWLVAYPPVDPGLPVVPASAIVEGQRALVDRLRRLVSVEASRFESLYLAPIEAVARQVLLLPSTPADAFAGPGGLFRRCLEMGLYCRQSAEGHLFTPHAGDEARHALEPRWRYAAFLAGLLCELRPTLAHACVTVPDGQVWLPTSLPLEPWLARSGAQRFHVVWRDTSAGASTPAERAMVAALVPAAGSTWLDDADASILRDVLDVALTGAPCGDARGPSGAGSALVAIVRATRSRIVAADALTQPARYGRVRFGHQVERHLLDAIRHLAAASPPGECTQGPWWFGRDGLYLEWPAAADAVRTIATGQGVSGLPLSPLSVADLLSAAGVLVPPPDGQGWWQIDVGDAALPGSTDAPPDRAWASAPGETRVGCRTSASLPPARPGADRHRTAIRFADPAIVLGPDPWQCVDRDFGVRGRVDGGRFAAKRAQDSGEGDETPFTPSNAVSSTTLREPIRLVLSQWQAALREGRNDRVTQLSGSRVAVSLGALVEMGGDPVRVVRDLDRHGWLGRGDWPLPDARTGLLSFAGRLSPGIVVNAEGAQAMGLATR